MAGPGLDPETTFVPPGNNEGGVGKETPRDVLIMNNLETSLATTVDKASGNVNGSIVERFVKPRASSIFCHPE